MNPTLFGIDPKWNSLIPLVAINVLMLSTVVVFALFFYKKKPGDPDLVGRHTSRMVGPFLREYWAWFISPIEKLFVVLGFSPNTLTTLGFLLSLVSAWAFATGHMGIAGWFMIIGGTFDMFDGRVARRTGKTSTAGAFYDAVMDRFGEAVVYLGLAYFYRDSWVLSLVLAALVGSLMVSYTKARGDSEGIDCKGGIMQRPERIVYLGVGSIFSPPFRQIVHPTAAAPIEYLTIAALAVIGSMTLLTAVYRMYYIFRKLKIRDGHVPKEPSTPLFRKFTHRYLDS